MLNYKLHITTIRSILNSENPYTERLVRVLKTTSLRKQKRHKSLFFVFCNILNPSYSKWYQKVNVILGFASGDGCMEYAMTSCFFLNYKSIVSSKANPSS